MSGYHKSRTGSPGQGATFETIGGAGLAIVGLALAGLGLARGKPVLAVPGAALAGGGGYLLYRELAGAAPPAPPPPPPGVPTAADILATRTEAELEELRAVFETAYTTGRITREQYDELYIAYVRQGYFLDLYLRGGTWVDAASEYLARTEKVTDLHVLRIVYDDVYEEYSTEPPPPPPPPDLPTVADILATRTEAERQRLRNIFEEAYAAGQITREQYDELYIAYIRQGYFLDLYLRGGTWVDAAGEYLARTEGVDNFALLGSIYSDIVEEYTSPPPPPGGATLRILVRDDSTGEPVRDARVRINLAGTEDWIYCPSNWDGVSYFGEITPGAYLLRASKEGYVDFQAPFGISEGEELELTVPLQPLFALPLGAIEALYAGVVMA